jgi:hypothetical protein
MLLILSCLTSCPGDSVESSTRLIHHVIRLMHALLILRASMRVRTHRDGNVHGGVQQAGRSQKRNTVSFYFRYWSPSALTPLTFSLSRSARRRISS